MNRLRAVCILSLIEAGLVAGGYLVTECCITFLYGRANAPFPRVIHYAVEYWWLLAAATVGWAFYAIQAEARFQRKVFSTYLPYALSGLLLGFTFLLYVAAFVVAAYGPPIRLTT
jgi:hypothetical protein